jgi:hypothetical protein
VPVPSPRCDPVQLRGVAPGSHDLGQGPEQHPDLGRPVAGVLHRRRVDAERHVVDEDPTVHLAEVHHSFAAVDEGVQGADDVVPIDAEVEGEVVARARRDAGERQPRLGGDSCHHRLRAVASGHGHGVGTVGDGGADQRPEVRTGLQLDRLDAAGPGFHRQAVPRRLPVTGPRIDEQHGALRPLRRRQFDTGVERDPGSHVPDQGAEREQQQDAQESLVGQQEHPTDQGGDGDGKRRGAGPPPAEHALPGTGGCQQAAYEDQQPTREVLDRDRDGRGQGEDSRTDCQDGRRPAIRRPSAHREPPLPVR